MAENKKNIKRTTEQRRLPAHRYYRSHQGKGKVAFGIGRKCSCGCGQILDQKDQVAGRTVYKLGHRMGSDHPNWCGNDVKDIRAARDRAHRRFPKEPCSICGNPQSEIHHRDGNVNNNSRENVQFVCRRCHMILDGRIILGKGICHKPKIEVHIAPVGEP